MTTNDYYTIHVREKFNLPENWHIVEYRAMPSGAPAGKYTYMQFKGAVAPLTASGGVDWRKRDKATELVVRIPCDEHDKWLLTWEQRTGNCHNCHGSGQAWNGWGVATGHRFKPCPRCGATGKAPPA